MFSSKGKQVSSAARLSWTPGDISQSAWQVTGDSLMDLHGAVVRDPSRRQPMYIISFAQYNLEATEQRRKARERRGHTAQPSTGQASGNKWRSSYVQVVKGKSKTS